jgi:S1-C subfamily serine protease
MTALVISVVVLAVQNIRLQKHMFSEAIRIDGIAEALKKTGAEAIRREDLADLRKVVEGRLESLEARTGELARIFAAIEGSIAFVQGTYGFIDPASGKPLRYTESPEGVYLFSAEEDGELVELTFTGTAFLVSPEGLLMTNKHVAEPWLGDERSEVPTELGLKPEHRRMRVLFPGSTEAFEVRPVLTSDEADLALLMKAGERILDVGALRFQMESPRPGDEVLVVGYPLGIAGMLVRTSSGFMDQARQEGVDAWQLVDLLAEGGYIRPLASRGIVSQISDQYVVYDAETATGGSGGPVLDASGSVVAINAAIVSGFGGSNLGVLSMYARRLMQRYQGSE